MFASSTIRRAAAVGVLALISGVCAAADAAGEKERYQQERADCAARPDPADRKVCMQDAGAAYGQARRNGLASTGNLDYASNAVQRCAALRGDDQQACRLRMQGQGTVQGSVNGGGLLRQIELPVK